MSVYDQLKWSLKHSKRQLLESLLVVLAIALGVGVIITVLAMFLSVGQQLRQNEDAQHFRTLEVMGRVEAQRRTGAPLSLIGSDLEAEDWNATLENLQEFQENLPSTMHAYVQRYWSGQTTLLSADDLQEDPGEEAMSPSFDPNQLMISGTTPEYFSFNNWTLKSGNLFLTSDLDNENRVMVLTERLAQELFADQEPIGQVIPISAFGFEAEPQHYTVIGVLASQEQGDVFAYSDNRMAYVPVTASPYPAQFEGGGRIDFSSVSIGIDPGVDIASATERAENEARLIWGDQIVVRSLLADYRESQSQMQRYALLMGLFSSVGLVIAVINILNLMLARVLKRTKSIGLSMALGSSRQLVFRQFILEALSLGILGSVLGIVLSFGLVAILENTLGGSLMDGMWGTRMVLGIVIGFVVSLFFGVYPAYLGSKTNPVDALRTD